MEDFKSIHKTSKQSYCILHSFALTTICEHFHTDYAAVTFPFPADVYVDASDVEGLRILHDQLEQLFASARARRLPLAFTLDDLVFSLYAQNLLINSAAYSIFYFEQLLSLEIFFLNAKG